MADWLEAGIAALNLGNRATGRRLLTETLKANYRSEAVWMRLALGLEDPQMKKDCFQKVLSINPNNIRANQEFIRLQVFRLRLKQQPGRGYTNGNHKNHSAQK